MAVKNLLGAFDWEKELATGQTTIPSASGAFNTGPISPSLYTTDLLVYNVGILNPAPLVQEVFTGPAAFDQAMECAKAPVPEATPYNDLIRVIEEDELMHLGEALVALAAHFVRAPYDLAIFPLRGGRRLEIILHHMLPGHGPFEHMLSCQPRSPV